MLQDIPSGPVLVFAPEGVVVRRLSELVSASRELLTTDLANLDVTFPGQDIQALDLGSDQFAMIVCNHVLEHVLDDRAAIRECARILLPGGMAVMTVPGDWDRTATWDFDMPDDNGHLRHYGMDFVDRLSDAFQAVRVIDLGKIAPREAAVRSRDLGFVARKTAASV